METLNTDIAIIGGGVIGCSTAHFIKSMAPDAGVVVIEPDPTYALASTLRASGGCRVPRAFAVTRSPASR